jgi:hypothetical protein
VPWKRIGAVAGAGAALGASVLFNRIATERAESDHPPSGAFIDVGGVRLHYRDRGVGSPILLLTETARRRRISSQAVSSTGSRAAIG